MEPGRCPPGRGVSKGTAPQREEVPAQEAPASADPRQARIEAACTRIEDELAQSPASVHEVLGDSSQIAQALRSTCEGLLARERTLRAESTPEALSFLEKEQAELEQRAGSATDARVRASLQSAVAAIAEQRRQRILLRDNADRLDAEVTRLSWTLDAMATQLVRLRTAGESVQAPPAQAMFASVRQLQEEIDAIADALEEVGGGQPTSARAPSEPLPEVGEPISSVGEEAEGPHPVSRTRNR
jgi:chromosome segregation ATPase